MNALGDLAKIRRMIFQVEVILELLSDEENFPGYRFRDEYIQTGLTNANALLMSLKNIESMIPQYYRRRKSK